MLFLLNRSAQHLLNCYHFTLFSQNMLLKKYEVLLKYMVNDTTIKICFYYRKALLIKLSERQMKKAPVIPKLISYTSISEQAEQQVSDIISFL